MTLPIRVPPIFAADVLVVGSYHEGDVCGQPQQNAAIDALKQSEFKELSFKEYHLNARFLSDMEVNRIVERIVSDIRNLKPKFVIVSDDPAFSRLYEEILEHPETRMIFTGLNRSLDEYNDKARFMENRVPVANITGVFEYLFMREQFSMAEAILGKALNRVAVLYSTDAVGMIVKDQILTELKGTEYERRVVSFVAEDLPSLVETARRIDEDDTIDAYIPVTLSIHDPASDQRMDLSALAPIITEIIRKMDLSINSSFTEAGFFGGVSIDFYQMGFEGGYMAIKLLRGIPIRDIPIVDAGHSIVSINRARARRLGIRIDPAIQSIVDQWK
jgi:hypothetical protein